MFMSMEKKNLLYLCTSFCLLIAMTIAGSHLRKAETAKIAQEKKFGSRSPASVSNKRYKYLLSKQELMSLKPKDLEKYLRGVSRALTRFDLKNKNKRKKVSKLWIYLTSKAFAVADSADFKDGCFLGFIASVKQDCDGGGWTRLHLSPSTASQFANVVTENGITKAACPSGEQMCSPAIYGFEFENNKAKLICYPFATAKLCYDKISTNGEGDRLRRSAELLNKANPDLWDNLGKGVIEICKPKSGGAKNVRDTTNCKILKNQLSYLTQESRGALQQYKDLAALVNGDSDELKSLSEYYGEESAGEAPVSELCSDLEKRDQPLSLSSDDIAGLMQKTNASRDSIDFLRVAGAVCNKPLSQMINEYGTCSASSLSNREVQRVNTLEREDSERRASAKEAVDQFASSIDKDLVQELMKLESGASASTVAKTVSDFFKYREISSGRQETQRIMSTWLYLEERGVPVLSTLKDDNMPAVSSIEDVLNKISNGDRLSENDRARRAEFRSRYGIAIEDVKGIFCHSDQEKKDYGISTISSQSNWNGFMKPCLTEMGFNVSSNRAQAVRNSRGEVVGGGHTISATVLDRNRARRVNRDKIVNQKCEWVDNDNERAKLISYLTGSEESLPEGMYAISRNYQGERVCKRVTRCRNTTRSAKSIQIGNIDTCYGHSSSRDLNMLSSLRYKRYICRLSINGQYTEGTTRPESNNTEVR